jgi:hypothetical protein
MKRKKEKREEEREIGREREIEGGRIGEKRRVRGEKRG